MVISFAVPVCHVEQIVDRWTALRRAAAAGGNAGPCYLTGAWYVVVVALAPLRGGP
jgi:hypothetical protein